MNSRLDIPLWARAIGGTHEDLIAWLLPATVGSIVFWLFYLYIRFRKNDPIDYFAATSEFLAIEVVLLIPILVLQASVLTESITFFFAFGLAKLAPAISLFALLIFNISTRREFTRRGFSIIAVTGAIALFSTLVFAPKDLLNEFSVKKTGVVNDVQK